MLTLAALVDDPSLATSSIVLPDGSSVTVRPLVPEDVYDLVAYLRGLSPSTRRFASVWDDVSEQAREHVDAIGRYDKLRLVLDSGPDGIVGLLEISLDLVDDDVARFGSYGVELGPADARFGLCIADAYQGRGVAEPATFAIAEVMRAFGRTRLILWGGVFDDNPRARRFYERLGFVELGAWTNDDGELVHDGLLGLT